MHPEQRFGSICDFFWVFIFLLIMNASSSRKEKKGQNKRREGESKLVFVMNWINGIIKLLFHHYRGKNREYCVYELCFCSLSNIIIFCCAFLWEVWFSFIWLSFRQFCEEWVAGYDDPCRSLLTWHILWFYISFSCRLMTNQIGTFERIVLYWASDWYEAYCKIWIVMFCIIGTRTVEVHYRI